MLWRYGIVGLLYLIVGCCVIWPVPQYFDTTIVGGQHTDIWSHLWGFWRTERDVLGKGILPYEEPLLNYPYGGRLYHVDLLNSFYMLPLTSLFGRIAGYNVLVILHIVVSGMATFGLLYHYTKNKWVSILCSPLFVFSAFFLSFPLSSGVSERLHIELFPIYLWILLGIHESPQKPLSIIGFSIIGALIFGLATIGCWHYGLFVFLMTVFFCLWHIPINIHSNAFELKNTTKELLRYIPLATFCAAIAFPISQLASGSSQVGERGSFVQRKHELFWDGSRALDVQTQFSIQDLFVGGQDALKISNYFDQLYTSTYLGIGVLLLSVAGFLIKKARFSSVMTLVFATLCLGPRIFWSASEYITYSWFYHFVVSVTPYMSGLDEPFEFVVLAVFFSTISVGIVLQEIWKRSPLFASVLVCILLSSHIYNNPAPIPVKIANVPQHKFYTIQTTSKHSYSILDFPPKRQGTALFPGEYFYFQTIHKKPIPHAVDAGWLREDPLWMDLSDALQGQGASPIFDELLGPCRAGATRGCGYIKRVKKQLLKLKMGYVVVHRKSMQREKLPLFENLFVEMFDEPVYKDNDIIVYCLHENCHLDSY
jgi:hypothetical protein